MKNCEPALSGSFERAMESDPALVRLAVELGLDLVPRPAHAMRRTVRILAVGIAALDHETGNDAMKGRAVIEAFLGQRS